MYPRKNSWPRSEASTATLKLQSFSRGNYPPMYQQAGKGFIYFTSLRIISQGERTLIVPAYFVGFFMFLCAELTTSFLISPSLASAKRILLFSMTN